jgi:predicted nuclease of predicted toxin-antitoxin system
LKFLVDSAVSPEIAAELRRIGHDAVHVSDYGLGTSSDEVVLMRAGAESRMVVTSDTDFGELMAESGALHPFYYFVPPEFWQTFRRKCPPGAGFE